MSDTSKRLLVGSGEKLEGKRSLSNILKMWEKGIPLTNIFKKIVRREAMDG